MLIYLTLHSWQTEFEIFKFKALSIKKMFILQHKRRYGAAEEGDRERREGPLQRLSEKMEMR